MNRKASIDRFLLMTCFKRTVETGSFSAAARDLGMGQPNVSRYVAALERHLGTRLLQRTTRRLAMTPEGERYYADVCRILDAVVQSESSLSDEAEPGGLLRVACPTALAHTFLMPHIPAFLARYPGLSLDLQLSDRFVDLVEEGAELAIRIGHPHDSALRARRIGLFSRVYVASADYLRRRGTPRLPQDLHDHDCILYSLLNSGDTWHFRDAVIPVAGRLRVNSPQAVQQAVSAGLGIASGPRWLYEQGLESGALCEVLCDHQAPAVPIQFLYVANRLLPRRAIVFMDFIAEVFAGIPGLNTAHHPHAPI